MAEKTQYLKPYQEGKKWTGSWADYYSAFRHDQLNNPDKWGKGGWFPQFEDWAVKNNIPQEHRNTPFLHKAASTLGNTIDLIGRSIPNPASWISDTTLTGQPTPKTMSALLGETAKVGTQAVSDYGPFGEFKPSTIEAAKDVGGALPTMLLSIFGTGAKPLAMGTALGTTTYAQTDDPVQGIGTGVVGAFVPKIFASGRQATYGLASKVAPSSFTTATRTSTPFYHKALPEALRRTTEYTAKTTATKAAGYVGANVGVIGAFEVGSHMLPAKIRGEKWGDILDKTFSEENIVANWLVGQIPFSALDAYNVRKANKTQQALEANTTAHESTTVANEQPVVNKSKLYDNVVHLTEDGTPTPVHKAKQVMLKKGLALEHHARIREIRELEQTGEITPQRSQELITQVNRNYATEISNLPIRPENQLNSTLFGELIMEPREGGTKEAIAELRDVDPKTVTEYGDQITLIDSVLSAEGFSRPTDAKLHLEVQRRMDEGKSFEESLKLVVSSLKERTAPRTRFTNEAPAKEDLTKQRVINVTKGEDGVYRGEEVTGDFQVIRVSETTPKTPIEGLEVGEGEKLYSLLLKNKFGERDVFYSKDPKWAEADTLVIKSEPKKQIPGEEALTDTELGRASENYTKKNKEDAARNEKPIETKANEIDNVAQPIDTNTFEGVIRAADDTNPLGLQDHELLRAREGRNTLLAKERELGDTSRADDIRNDYVKWWNSNLNVTALSRTLDARLRQYRTVDAGKVEKTSFKQSETFDREGGVKKFVSKDEAQETIDLIKGRFPDHDIKVKHRPARGNTQQYWVIEGTKRIEKVDVTDEAYRLISSEGEGVRSNETNTLILKDVELILDEYIKLAPAELADMTDYHAHLTNPSKSVTKRHAEINRSRIHTYVEQFLNTPHKLKTKKGLNDFYADVQRELRQQRTKKGDTVSFNNKDKAKIWFESAEAQGFIKAVLGDVNATSLKFQKAGKGKTTSEVALVNRLQSVYQGVGDFVYKTSKAFGLSDKLAYAHARTAQRLTMLFPESITGKVLFSEAYETNRGELEIQGLYNRPTNSMHAVVDVAVRRGESYGTRYTLGHEYGHAFFQAYRDGRLPRDVAAKIDTLSEMLATAPEGEVHQVLLDLADTLPSKMRDEVKAVMERVRESGQKRDASEVIPDLLSLFAMNATSGRMRQRFKEMYRHLPAPVKRVLDHFVTFFRDGVQRLRAMKKEQPVFLRGKDALKKTIEDTFSQLESVARTQKQIAKLERQASRLALMEPQTFKDLLLSHDAEGTSLVNHKDLDFPPQFQKAKEVVNENVFAPITKWLRDNIAPIHQIMHKTEFQEFAGLTAQVQSKVRTWMTDVDNARRTMWVEGGKPVQADNFNHLKPILIKGSRAQKVLNEILLDQNKTKTPFIYESTKVNTILKKKVDGLNKKDKVAVLSAVQGQRLANSMSATNILRARAETATASLATILQVGTNKNRSIDGTELMRPKEAKELAEALWEMTVETSSPRGSLDLSPARKEQLNQRMSKLLDTVPVKTVTLAMDVAQAGVEGWSSLGKMLTETASYFSSERRLGRFQLGFRVNKTDKTGRISADSKRELARQKKEQEAIHGKITWDIEGETTNLDYTTADAKVISEVVATDKANQDALLKVLQEHGGMESVIKSLDQYFTSGEGLAKQAAAKDLVRPGINREFKPGRESINMFQNQQDFFNSLFKNEAMLTLSREEALYRSDSVLKAVSPEKFNLVIKALENFREPDKHWSGVLTKATFGYFLGFNLSSHMLEGTQTMFSLVPNIIVETGSTREAYGKVNSAIKAVTDFHVVQRGKEKGTYGSKLRDELMAQAHKNQYVGNLGHATDYFANDNTLLDTRQLRSIEKGRRPGQVAVDGAEALIHHQANFYKVFTNFNARVALLTGIDVYSQQILKGKNRELTQAEKDTVLAQAQNLNLVANFSGGKAGRPVGLFSFLGNGIGATAFALQSYTAGMGATYVRMISRGYGKSSKNRTPAERKAHRKALHNMLATQFIAAGAMGTVGLGAALALLNQAFPDLEVEKNLREGIGKILGVDHTGGLGKSLNELVQNGLLSMLPGFNKLDFQSRYSLGGTVGINPYEGADTKAVFGPAFSIAENLHSGMSEAIHGKWGKALEYAAPQFLKKPLHLARNDFDSIEDRGGQTISEGLSPIEKIGFALGFRTKDIAEFQNYKKLDRTNAEAKSRRDRRFADNVAKLFNAGKIDEGLREVGKQLEENPNTDLTAIKTQITNAMWRKIPASVHDVTPYSRAADMQTLLNQVMQQPKSTQERKEIERQKVHTLLDGTYGPFERLKSHRRIEDARMRDLIQQKFPSQNMGVIKEGQNIWTKPQ